MGYADYNRVGITSEGRVVTAVIDSPPLNLITRELLDELGRLTTELVADPEPLVVVIKSADPDFFIPHAEFANLYSVLPAEAPQASDNVSPNNIHQICERLRTMDKITIAQVEGRAGGGGAALVMACDMRFGAIGKAVFNNMAVPLGTVPGGGASQYMPRLVGRSRALELILGGVDLDAITAERWGYLNRALPPEELAAFVQTTARRIASCPPDAVRLTKRAIDAAGGPMEEGLREESFRFQQLMTSEDSIANIKRFLALGGETRAGEKRLGELLGEVIERSE
jgi:enoyl-CoA hydratase/carnithine racemase